MNNKNEDEGQHTSLHVCVRVMLTREQLEIFTPRNFQVLKVNGLLSKLSYVLIAICLPHESNSNLDCITTTVILIMVINMETDTCGMLLTVQNSSE